MTREDVERAIRDGTRYLKQEQRADGSWDDANTQARTGTTSLVTLALLTAGERPDSPVIRKALDHLRRFGPDAARSTYAIALQTMVFAAAEPERDQLRIAANVDWLEAAQIKPGQHGPRAAGPTSRGAQRRRQLEHPVRAAGPQRGRRGRRPGQARGLGPRPGSTGRRPSAATAAGATTPATRSRPRA